MWICGKTWFKVVCIILASSILFMFSGVIISTFSPPVTQQQSMLYMKGMMNAMMNSLMGQSMMIGEDVFLQKFVLLSAFITGPLIVWAVIAGILVKTSHHRHANRHHHHAQTHLTEQLPPGGTK